MKSQLFVKCIMYVYLDFSKAYFLFQLVYFSVDANYFFFDGKDS